jgi:hypothetical protein
MKTLTFLSWCVVLTPLLGLSFCFWSERDSEIGNRKTKVRFGLLLGLGAAASSIVQLFIAYLPMNQFEKWNFLFFGSLVFGLAASVLALDSIRRFAAFDVRSIGTISVMTSALSMCIFALLIFLL